MPALAPLIRGVNWWYDQEGSGRATRIFLFLFILAWTTFQIVSYSSIALHPDILETYAWGRHPTGGYYKQPPLAAWVTAIWFAVFPATDWSFHLLAMANAALALYGVDLIARRYLSGDKRLLVLLPIMLLAPASAELPRPRAVWLAMAVAVITVAALSAAPVIAWRNHVNGTKEDRGYFQPAAEHVERQWQATTKEPLRIVTGTMDLAAALTFYLPDHPDSVPNHDPRLAPWIAPERMAQDGWVAVCRTDDSGCIDLTVRRSATQPGARPSEFEAVPTFLGRAGTPVRYVMVVVPPQREARP